MFIRECLYCIDILATKEADGMREPRISALDKGGRMSSILFFFFFFSL